MSAAPARALYTRDMLELAVELAAAPFDGNAPLIGEARSRACGSVLRLSAQTDIGGGLHKIGLSATSCAVGQAAAALFMRGAEGLNAPALDRAIDQIERWLQGAAPEPSWPGLAAIAAARDFPARHGAILLPWKAAADALSRAPLAS